MTWPAVGSYWEKSSVIWGRAAGSGEEAANASPLGPALQMVRLLDGDELARLFAVDSDFRAPSIVSSLASLAGLLRDLRRELIEEFRLSTGFSREDCEEMANGCISFAERFQMEGPFDSQEYRVGGRRIGLHRAPWGTVAAILPQNASFYMGLIVLVNALAAENRVILRVPSGAYRLMAILARLVAEAGFDPRSFSVVACDAKTFMSLWRAFPGSILLHYMGSSRRAGELLADAFSAGKPCLIDGEGNGWAYVDQDQDPAFAARLVWSGAIRYNGQTCTSVNGVLVHPSIDLAFRQEIRRIAGETRFGLANDAEVGPLFHEGQVSEIERLAKESGGRVGRRGQSAGKVSSPLLIEDPAPDSELVKEGLFGPAMWLRSGNWNDFQTLWRTNRYPLSAAVLSFDASIQESAKSLSGASRIVLNGDPSQEDPLEPWGAYPSSGSNPVGRWMDKYWRVVQVDRRD